MLCGCGQGYRRHFPSPRCAVSIVPVQGELLKLAEKILARVRVDEKGCWVWTGASHSKGYGQVWFNKKQFSTHRAMMMATDQVIPPGMQVDHLCRNPPCCNPAHLEIVTPAENVRRGRAGHHARERALAQTHCRNGHPRNAQNTYVPKTGRGHCRICALQRKARRYAINQEAGLTQAGRPRKRALSPKALTPQQLRERYDAR